MAYDTANAQKPRNASVCLAPHPGGQGGLSDFESAIPYLFTTTYLFSLRLANVVTLSWILVNGLNEQKKINAFWRTAQQKSVQL